MNKKLKKKVADHVAGKGKPKSFSDPGLDIPGLVEKEKEIKPKDVFVGYKGKDKPKK
jgi:hypothetical protein